MRSSSGSFSSSRKSGLIKITRFWRCACNDSMRFSVLSGAGFMFYADSGQSNLEDWCETMRERYLSNLSAAIGLSLGLIEKDGPLFGKDPEHHFYRRFGSRVIESLEAGKPVLAYNCTNGQTWDIVSGFSNGRLLCRSVHDRTSPSGLIDRIQPYEPNASWPLRIVLIGDERDRPSSSDLIRSAIEAAIEIGEGLHNGVDKAPVTGPTLLTVWADAVSQEPTSGEIRGHQRVRKTLIDARISLERFLRWVAMELGSRESKRIIDSVRKHFARSFEILMSTDISENTMADKGARQGIVERIRSLHATETSAFEALRELRRELGKG